MGQRLSQGTPRAVANDWHPVRVSNPDGHSQFVILCDHASNHIPASFGTLGLDPDDLQKHIAWDPGALGVSQVMSRELDAALVESCVSRLIVDCNRPLNAPDLVPSLSEVTTIPGNVDLNEVAKSQRIALSHKPYHEAIEKLAHERAGKGLPDPTYVAVHSYTPVYRGVTRPWHIGVIHDDDDRVAAPLIAGLQALSEFNVGINQPYSPADRVYYTLERHASAFGLPAVMIEIRNDLITTAQEQQAWGKMLSRLLTENIQNPPPGMTGISKKETVNGK
ncbi:N-formylglutamate amidohydrolase [Phyllobacterium bourgognense]|uniref:Putative N-formylglutamate amidohydrolase n=1 Tax=Phyllobacterium bourgognense TaxID=314236 RepID=A0A368YTX3_9HYPH|nr:N-formylglutamate amidohydrolase [Phyllobacterium bourgognense]RCW83028.1 putative N-formylglutamate amidohydrolase [Phyllobacterium bourgognense]